MTDMIIHQDRHGDHLQPALALDQAVERFNAVTAFTKKVLRDGIDFGTIPGTNKPTLLKPGAEKLTTFFGLTVRFQVVERIEDWAGKEHDGEPFFYYVYRCQLWRGDLLIAESDASCNSWESKYRWRASERRCPHCGAAAIIKGKAEYGGGWLCFAKKNGCGAKFGDQEPAIVEQTVGRVPNPDICDLVNTIQKMSQKRALIAATLLAVNASEFFTQDVEDMVLIGDAAPPAPAQPQEKAPTPRREAAPPPRQPITIEAAAPVQQPADPEDDFFGPATPRQSAKISHCRSCQAEVIWGTSAAGKKTPYDVVDGQKSEVSHFFTCPDAKQWSGSGGGR